MARYSGSINGVALSTTNDLRTIETTATGAGSVVKVSEIYLAGEAGSSAVARVVVNRPSVAPTGAGTPVVAEKLDPASVAAAFEFNSTYASSQATLSTNDVLILGFNAFGGVVRWLAMPEFEIVVGSQGAVAYLSVRSRSGTSTVSGHIIVEER
jgi:hypothetical protein